MESAPHVTFRSGTRSPPPHAIDGAVEIAFPEGTDKKTRALALDAGV